MADQAGKKRVLEQIRSRLCSGSQRTRERNWRALVEALGGHKIASEAITELLSVTGGPGPLGAHPGLRETYHNLGRPDKEEVDNLYRRCLEKAQDDFPDIFKARQ